MQTDPFPVFLCVQPYSCRRAHTNKTMNSRVLETWVNGFGRKKRGKTIKLTFSLCGLISATAEDGSRKHAPLAWHAARGLPVDGAPHAVTLRAASRPSESAAQAPCIQRAAAAAATMPSTERVPHYATPIKKKARLGAALTAGRARAGSARSLAVSEGEGSGGSQLCR